MVNNSLSTPSASSQQDQDIRRSVTIGGSVSEVEKDRILAALDNSGWNQSAGVRVVMLAFAESIAVRDAVFAHVRQPVA